MNKQDKLGITKREYFAAAALQGLLAAVAASTAEECRAYTPDYVADWVVKFSDATLKKLQESKI